MKDWEEFEHLAQRIQADLAPDAQVLRDEKLRGRSGVDHQCDLVLRTRAGQFQFTCIIECKDKRAKVNLETVRAFDSRLKDLSASQGVIVAAKGFTRDALRYAKAHGILTYTLFDTKSLKWNKQALVPLVVGFVMLKEGGAEFTNLETGKLLQFHEQPGIDWRTVPLYDIQTKQWTTLGVYLEHKWDEYADTRSNISTDTYGNVDASGRYQLYANKRLYRVSIRYWIKPYFMWCYSRMPLVSGRGFVDQATGSILLGADYDAQIPLIEAYEKWPRVEKLEDVPHAPVDNLLFKVICFYHGASKGSLTNGFPEAITFARRRRNRFDT